MRPNDLDALGHVNNAVALEYFEAGRWDWMRRRGLAPSTGVAAVVERVDVTYHAEIPCGQVEVRTELTSPTAAEFDWDDLTYRARFAQRLHLSGKASPAVAALVTVAFIDARRRCPVSMQEFLADAGARRSTTPSSHLSVSMGERNE